MRLSAVLALIVISAVGRSVPAQAVKVGDQPALAPVAANTACKESAPNDALRRTGIASGLMVQDADRMISLWLSANGKPMNLHAMIGKAAGPRRRESESVAVAFDANGKVVRGDRTAFSSGVPAKLSDDRRAGLLPTDTAAAIALVRSILARCHR